MQQVLKNAQKGLKVQIKAANGSIAMIWEFPSFDNIEYDIDLAINKVSENKDKISELLAGYLA